MFIELKTAYVIMGLIVLALVFQTGLGMIFSNKEETNINK